MFKAEMGKHYLLNLYGCSFVLLDDQEYLIKLLEEAASISGATVVNTIFKKFDPQGVTVLTLLSESHISIHTWPEKGEAAVDLFTCGDCNPKIGCDMIIEQLYATNHTFSYIER
jgi:S-adenosylmethionine decarboxylase